MGTPGNGCGDGVQSGSAFVRIMIVLALGFEVAALVGIHRVLGLTRPAAGAAAASVADSRASTVPKADPITPESRTARPPLLPLSGEGLPKFTDYSVAEVFRGKPADVDLASNPNARTFRTRLREGAAGGPNFAGHYTVVTWGCGTECQVVAIVDAINGAVFFPGIVSAFGVDYRLDSTLLIENPPGEYLAQLDHMTAAEVDDDRRLYGGPNYWVWDGARLDLVAGDRVRAESR